MSDTRMICLCTDCKWNDDDGGCLLDEIRIIETFHADAPAMCEGYEEDE